MNSFEQTASSKLQRTTNLPPYSGFLNIYKEAGYTSMDVCAKLRGILHMKKIGHAGTLDPMAEGVLPVALGRATKEVDRIGDGTKTYRAGMLLGTVTDTQDVTGTVISACDVLPAHVTEEAVRKAASSFLGVYEQLTPMYSARKVNGKKLYEYARAGKEVERKKKTVEILSLEIETIDLPHVVMTVRCTKGTYIRTLCHDIGAALGCGACMESLLRTQVGDFLLEDAVKLSEVERCRDEGTVDGLISIKAETAVALGKFDGNHLGHQKLFSELRKTAQERKLRTCILVLDVGKRMLKDPKERRGELQAAGMDYVIELPFTEALRHMGAEEFVREILIKKLNMKAIVAGEDVSFGYEKSGNAKVLKELSEKYGYEVTLIEKLCFAEPEGAAEKMQADAAQPVSSTRIRDALSAGEMERAAALLGEPYSISGTVVHGRHLGAPVLGFPTLNLVVEKNRALPPFGVYATRTFIYPKDTRSGGQKQSAKAQAEPLKVYEGISNLGKKPTLSEAADYDAERVDLETHLFDFSEDAYGREIRVELLSFLRPEQKFESLEKLRMQLLETDADKAKKILAKMRPA